MLLSLRLLHPKGGGGIKYAMDRSLNIVLLFIFAAGVFADVGVSCMYVHWKWQKSDLS